MRRSLISRALTIAVASLILSSCYQHYSFEQEKVELDSLGEELWKIWHKDAARAPENAEAKAAMLEEQHNDFVDAVNTIAPEDQLAEIDAFLINLLTLIDDGIVPALTRKLIVILEDAAADMELLRALAEPTGPPADTFVTPDAQPNLLGYITGYPELVGLLRFQTRIMLENDGFTDDGSRTFEEPAGISDLVRVLALELREDLEPSEEPLALTLRDLLLVEDSAYEPPTNPAPASAALFDERGYPLPAENGDTLPFPFTDADGDGLADVDGDGNFVLENGDSVPLRPFAFQGDINEPVTRDALGRAMTPNGPAFQYVDLHRTALGFLIRQQHQLSQKDTLYDMLGAFKVIMGPKQAYTDEIGGYEGYPQEQPLMDMSHAMIHMMDSPGLPDMLDGLSAMHRDKAQALAKLFWAIDDMIDVLNEFPDAGMTDDQTMVYDLLPYLQEIVADPELWADVMAALREPVSKRTGDAFATMIAYKDSDSIPEPKGPYDSCFQSCRESFDIGTINRFECIRACPMDEIFDEPMDYSAPESPENNSAYQKFNHLLRDMAGKEYSMAIAEASFDGDPLPEVPPLLSLPDSAAAMVAAIAGNLWLGDYVPDELWDSALGELLEFLGVDSGNVASLVATISPLFGPEDSGWGLGEYPRPDEITRLFNLDDIKFETERVVLDPEDPVCHDGYIVSKHYGYALYQAEAAGVVDAIYPLAKAFSDHDREALLVNMMTVLHDHYAGDASVHKTKAGGPSPMKAANLRSYEPALAKIFGEGQLFEALNDFANAQYEVEQETGIAVTESLRLVLSKALQPGMQNRRGETFVVINDGRTASNASAMHHFLWSIDEAAARLDGDPEAKQKLEDAVGNMAKVMVATEKDGAGVPRFKDPGSVALTAHLTAYMADEAREKQAAGELSPWLTEDALGSMEEFWRSRTLTALIDLADEALSDPADKELMDNFMTYLLGGVPGQTQVLVAVHQLLVQSIARDRWLPVARFLSRVIDPDRSWNTEPYKEVPMVTLGALMLKKTLDADPENTGIFLIHRGLDRPQYQDAPFTILIDVIARYLSPDPSKETFEKPGDYQQFFTEMAAYLADDTHGMERLYEIVERRVRPEEAAPTDSAEPTGDDAAMDEGTESTDE